MTTISPRKFISTKTQYPFLRNFQYKGHATEKRILSGIADTVVQYVDLTLYIRVTRVHSCLPRVLRHRALSLSLLNTSPSHTVTIPYRQKCTSLNAYPTYNTIPQLLYVKHYFIIIIITFKVNIFKGRLYIFVNIDILSVYCGWAEWKERKRVQ